MTMGVIHLLEVIDVDHHHRERFIACSCGDKCRGDVLVQSSAIEELHQSIFVVHEVSIVFAQRFCIMTPTDSRSGRVFPFKTGASPTKSDLAMIERLDARDKRVGALLRETHFSHPWG